MNTALWLAALNSRLIRPISEQDLLAWIDGPLRCYFPFERFFGGYGELSFNIINIKRSVSVGYPSLFLSQIEASFTPEKRGCFAWWLNNRAPFVLDANAQPDFATLSEIEEIKVFGLGLVAAHGVIDPIASVGTYFSFSGVPERGSAVMLDALELIAPVLNGLYLESLGGITSKLSAAGLTGRQLEIVQLAISGYEDKDIAKKLTISEHTVGNHLREIYRRLGVKKRSELVAFWR